MSYDRWMKEAIREAGEAEAKGEVPIGAVLVREGEIIGRGHNLRESHQDPTAHAEMIAIREAAASWADGDWRDVSCMSPWNLAPCAQVPSSCPDWTPWSTVRMTPRAAVPVP